MRIAIATPAMRTIAPPSIGAPISTVRVTPCVQAAPPVQGLVGRSVGRGWRKTINEVLGGVQGCTHMRELLFNMATAAYQTMWPWRETERRRLGQDRAQPLEPPPHIGQCMTWAVDSPVTARIEPMFYRPRKPASETASS